MNLLESFELLNSNKWNFSKSTMDERSAKLKRLKTAILLNRSEIKAALYQDFSKPEPETELTEIHTVLDEINYAVNHLKSWMKPTKVKTPVSLIGAKSRIYHESKGITLIMSPWNYPFYLIMSPLISAIASGSVVMLRPSEKAPATSLIINKIINDVFSTNEVVTALGGFEISVEILNLPFEHIFFTGSIPVGKIVMEKASKNLASVTLELGGKSPVFIDSDVDLEDSVKKMIWGKYLNAGQTCVAPDYVFVPRSLKENFLKLVKMQIELNYGDTINERKNNKDFARIIDEKNFDRLISITKGEVNLLEDLPSKEDNYFFPPTILPEATLSSKIMQEEIFGPILPVIYYDSIDEFIKYVKNHGKPLALYIFSKNKLNIKKIIGETSSGGVAVNHVLFQLGNPNLPFGGIGSSGMGGSHGYFGFRAFSHEKAVLIQSPFTLTTLFFPPYGTWLSKLVFKLLRFLE